MNNNTNFEYVRVNRDNPSSCIDFMTLGYEYMKEAAPDKSLEIHNKLLNNLLRCDKYLLFI